MAKSAVVLRALVAVTAATARQSQDGGHSSPTSRNVMWLNFGAMLLACSDALNWQFSLS